MKIGIIGLGLMGASFAKTLHAKTSCKVYGTDTNAEVLAKATKSAIIDGILTEQTACQIDILVAALYPRDFCAAVERFLPYLKDGAVVTDFCGNKRIVIQAMTQLATKYPQLCYVSGHPMAGREFAGIDHSVATLFDKASMILVPLRLNEEKLQFLKSFYLSLGFGEVVVCSAEYHDSVVAYTSQLCHVVSNAFIKNQSAAIHDGYSAGSYKDLTRVARMNSGMWAQLMTDNRDKLSAELAELIENLHRYQIALEKGDEQMLFDLLEEGNQRKLQIDSRKRTK